jgi:hypothetical protein
MKTTTPTAVQDFAPGDFFTYASTQYKVLGTKPHPGNTRKFQEETLVAVVDVDGVQDDLSLYSDAVFDVTKDDYMVGAPSHVVVDLLDGYTFARDARNQGFTEVTAWAFAKERNAASKRPTYRVFALSPVTEEN